MQFTYILKTKQDKDFKMQNTQPIAIGHAKVFWVSTNDGVLDCIKIVFKNIKLILNDQNQFDPEGNDTSKEAYKIATYLDNIVFIQTGMKIFEHPQTIFFKSPEVIAETEAEHNIFDYCLKKGWSDMICEINLVNDIDCSEYTDKYKYSQPYSYYADALRTEHPFVKYELFYKVIEFFFSKGGETLDNELSTKIQPVNAKYDQNYCKILRQLRNKTTHPKARLGHINLENIDDVLMINKYIEDIKNVAKILLDNMSV